jgi:transcriptional antiterminator NusG
MLAFEIFTEQRPVVPGLPAAGLPRRSSSRISVRAPTHRDIDVTELTCRYSFDPDKADEAVVDTRTAPEATAARVRTDEVTDAVRPARSPTSSRRPARTRRRDEQETSTCADDGPLEAFRRELWAKPGDWFVVHTYSGMEKRVKQNLENRIISLNMEDYIHEIVVPTEEVARSRTASARWSPAPSCPATSWSAWT